MSGEMHVEGMKKLVDQLERIGALAGLKILAAASRKAMVPVYLEARSLAPKRSGRLLRSIRIAVVKPRGGSIVCAAGLAMRPKIRDEIPLEDGALGPAALADTSSRGAGFRWHLAEFGVPSRGIPAHPFLRPAMMAKKGEVLAILSAEVQKKLAALLRAKDGGG